MTATSEGRFGPPSTNKPPIRVAVDQSLISADVRANGHCHLPAGPDILSEGH